MESSDRNADELNLCEVSMLPTDNHTIVAFLHENSGLGYDCKKVISHDNGESWGEIIDFPLPGCHRPTSGFLNDGSILITYRFIQGGLGGWGNPTQNLFAGLTDRASVLAEKRSESRTRIFPVDYDRSPLADLGIPAGFNFQTAKFISSIILSTMPWTIGRFSTQKITTISFGTKTKLCGSVDTKIRLKTSDERSVQPEKNTVR